KVWADAYLDSISSKPIYANLRMYFYTTYATTVAIAKRAISDAQGRTASCKELYEVGNDKKGTNVDALEGAACSSGAVNKPTRWCDVASAAPNDPAVDMNMNDDCRGPVFGGNYGVPYWHEWHDIKERTDAKIYDEKERKTIKGITVGITVPVYLDDMIFVGGVA